MLLAKRRVPFLSSFSLLRSSFSTGPLYKYNSYVEKKLINEDPYQRDTMTTLQLLHENVLKYQPKTIESTSKSSNIFNYRYFSWFSDSENEGNDSNSSKAPLGVYIYGGVGCGKTFMMDLFYEELPITRKSRSHFNTFMLDIHKRLYKLKAQSSKTSTDEGNHLEKIANEILQESYVICFDEFQVTDIADALLLKSLFTLLWRKGCVVVATSNRPPVDLYKDGLQRVLFLPFIDTVLNNMQVISMVPSPTDYRRLKHSSDHRQSSSLYFSPFSSQSLSSFLSHFSSLSHPSSPQPIPLSLSVYGHYFHIPQAILSVHYPSTSLHHIHSLSHTHVAMFHFNDLCGGGSVGKVPLGASDYILLAASFSTVFISYVPRLSLQDRNELRRFITLIDALYEGRVLVCLHAESSPQHLLNISDEEKKSTPFDEVFAFDRTVSRLLEMQSEDYLKSQYSEWLTRRSSSETLLTSLLQSQSNEREGENDEQSSEQLISQQTELARNNLTPTAGAGVSVGAGAGAFVPCFQVELLKREIITEIVKEEMSNLSSLSLSSILIGKIIQKSIEKSAGIQLSPLSSDQISLLSSYLTGNQTNRNVDSKELVDFSDSISLTQPLTFLSHDHSYRISTSIKQSRR